MGDLHSEGPESTRRAAARDRGAVPRAPMVPAGVSNHLLARTFQFKGKKVPEEAKIPRIHGVSAVDLKKLADDEEHDYGPITDAGSVAAAMLVYEQRHRRVVELLPLDETYAGYRTVYNDDEFAEHEGRTVRATFQLDSMQGKHDAEFAADKDARKKSGGQQMPPGSDYATLAQGVPADLTRERLEPIFATAEREPLNYAVQKVRQADGLQYEISARWATAGEGLHILVFYHCYPPR